LALVTLGHELRALAQLPRQQQREQADSQRNSPGLPVRPIPPNDLALAPPQAPQPYSEPKPDNEWLKPSTLINVALACAAFWAATIALDSLSAIEKQSRANELAVLYAHRPRLVIRHIVVSGISAGTVPDRLQNGRAWIVNTGPMPAQFIGIHAQWLIRDSLPANNPAIAVELGPVVSENVDPGHVIQRDLPDRVMDGVIEHARWWSDASDRSPDGYRIFLIGFIKYSDSIGIRRKYFAYRYSHRRSRFVSLKHPSYNYED